jgi:hypothetical protein
VSRGTENSVKNDVKLWSAVLNIREWRSRVAVVWLFVQVSSMALASASLPRPAAVPAAMTTCTCPGDHTDEACPMHRSGSSAGGGSGDCSMRSAHVPTDTALLSLAAGLGIPASSSIGIGPGSTRPLRFVAAASASVIDFPDSRPPRA